MRIKFFKPLKSPVSALFLIACFVFSGGCASVISKDILKDVTPDVTIAMVQSDPALHTGSRVVWGGVILSVENLEETSLVEVFQTPLTKTHRPTRELTAHTPGGRFLIEAKGYLDPVVYKKDRGITVAGVVKGIRMKKIDRMEYPYPVLSPLQVRLFMSSAEEYSIYPPSMFYYPAPFYDPYYNPYYWPGNPYWAYPPWGYPPR